MPAADPLIAALEDPALEVEGREQYRQDWRKQVLAHLACHPPSFSFHLPSTFYVRARSKLGAGIERVLGNLTMLYYFMRDLCMHDGTLVRASGLARAVVLGHACSVHMLHV